MVPVIEGLMERGHNVTFILPNTPEALEWFPKGQAVGDSESAHANRAEDVLK